MKTKETAFASALRGIIEDSFSNNKAELARASGIDRPVISILVSGRIAPTESRLSMLAGAMDKRDRKLLLLAAAKDYLPDEFIDEVMESSETLGRVSLPDDLMAVIDHLGQDCLNDPNTADYLRRIGRWMGVIADDGGQAITVELDESGDELEADLAG